MSPLLSLMQDQVEHVMIRGEKSVIAINSFLPFKQKLHALNHLHKYRFIFISPEMLALSEVKKALLTCSISIYVVDEAHCISQWGPDFRPDYLSLGQIKEELGSPVTLALTATATPKIRDDIRNALKMNTPDEWIHSVNRPNISLQVETASSFTEKVQLLKKYVSALKAPGIVYFSSKRLADELAEELNAALPKNISSYHAGLDQEQRILIQQQFLHNQLDWVFATSAFGMGVNKENIRTVIHFHLPSSMESFVQEIGRAGRDNKKSLSILLYSKGDEQIPLNLLELERPTLRQINDYKKWHRKVEKPVDLEEKIGITDIQNRVLQYYLSHERNDQYWADAVYKKMTDRLTEKHIKLSQVVAYAVSPICRRRMIVESFYEKRALPQPRCCDICGLELKEFEMPETPADEKNITDWKERLSLLF